MSSPNLQTDAAHSLLEDRIARYYYPPGHRLSPELLSEEIRIGIIPTRIALHWLHRDGLIDHVRSRGFFVKPPAASEARTLYRGVEIMLTGAVFNWNERTHASASAGDDDVIAGAAAQDAFPLAAFSTQGRPGVLVQMTETLFLAIARLCGGDIISGGMRTLNARLRFLREIECAILPNVGGELYAMQYLFATGHFTQLRLFLHAYHQERINQLDALIDAACAKALRNDAA